ncbi:transferase [Syncephalis fuscata]|nr:transferase [Syncephalis fuscata]
MPRATTLIGFYKNHEHVKDFMPTDRLTEGLYKTLDEYPIFYGRLSQSKTGRYEIRPSHDGIPFREVYSENDISMYEPNWPQASISKELQPFKGAPSEETPLFAAKITRFANNSGMVIGIAWHHYVTDGYGFAMFMRTWAAFCRNETPELPNHDRFLLEPEHSYPPYTYKDSVDLNKYAGRGAMIRFTPDKLVALKAAAVGSLSEEERKAGWLSTMDAVIVVLWRALVRARQLPAGMPLTQGSSINLRPQLESFPQNYFGNAIVIATMTKTVGDLLGNSLGSIAVAHRQSLMAHKNITKDDWLSQADVTSRVSQADRGSYWMAHTDYLFTDWSKFKYYTLDFGDGIPVRTRRFLIDNRAMVCVFDAPPTSTEKGSSLEHYAHFVADEELFTFADLLD